MPIPSHLTVKTEGADSDSMLSGRRWLVMLVVFAACFVSPIAAMAQSPAESSLYKVLTSEKSDEVTSAAVDRVLKSSDNYTATILLVASTAALHEKRLEDAGFLFHIAGFRMMFDKVLFPPKVTLGNDKMRAVADLRNKIGWQLNPALMAEPKVYAQVVARLKSWKPNVSPQYEPGWEYSQRDDEKETSKAMTVVQKQMIEHMSVESTLMLDAKYFAAFKIAQGYHHNAATTNQPSRKAYDDALQTMEQMEKEKRFRGMAYVTKQVDELKKASQNNPDASGKK